MLIIYSISIITYFLQKEKVYFRNPTIFVSFPKIHLDSLCNIYKINFAYREFLKYLVFRRERTTSGQRITLIRNSITKLIPARPSSI